MSKVLPAFNSDDYQPQYGGKAHTHGGANPLDGFLTNLDDPDGEGAASNIGSTDGGFLNFD